MRKIFFLNLVLFILLYSCKQKQTEKLATKKSLSLKCFFIKKNNNIPIYKIFFKKIDSKYCTIDSIFFIKTNQTFDISKKDLFYYTELIETFPFGSYIDYNFDGYNDICIYNNTFKNTQKSKTDFYYLFDKVSNKYIESTQLNSIDISNVCKKDKCIHSINYDFCDDPTIYKPYNINNCKHKKLTKYIWMKDSVKAIEVIEEEKIKNKSYSIKETNLITRLEQKYVSKISIIDDMNCK